MGAGSVLERIGLAHIDFDGTGADDVEQLFRHGDEVVALRRVGEEGGAGDEQRALLREDAEAKSYENTAVPPTNSRTLPRPQREEPEPEPERFSFEVDYALWSVEYADGTRRTFDSAQRSFVG